MSQLACDFAAAEGLYISTVNAVRGVPDSVKRLTLADESLIFDAVAQQTVDLVRSYISADGTGRVAIIAPDDMVKSLRRRVYEQLRETLPTKEFDRLNAQSSWDEQVTVCSTQIVKGLEYDGTAGNHRGERSFAHCGSRRSVCRHDQTDATSAYSPDKC